MSTLNLGILLSLSLIGSAAFGAVPGTQPATRKMNAWDGSLFKYDRPERLRVEQSTPTAAQVDWMRRPAQLKGESEPAAETAAVKPRTVDQMDILRLRFKDTKGDSVPVLLCVPAGAHGPFPLVIAVHGLGSNKAQVCAQVAPFLTRQGFAVLAPDMPYHGERPGQPQMIWGQKDPRKTFENFRQAIIDVRQCIDLAETLPMLDVSRGVILAGYSMGSFIDSVVGPVDDRVQAMVLMVGGAYRLAAATALLPQMVALDPASAIPHFAPRPLLLLNGKADHIIAPEMARFLFDAAAEPKKQLWYDSGHLLPTKAYEDAAEWVAQTWKAVAPADAGKQ